MNKKSIVRFWRKNGPGYAMLAPFYLFFFLFVIIPVLFAIGLSMTNYNMIETPSFTFLTNYKLLIMDDDEFLIALKNTFDCGTLSDEYLKKMLCIVHYYENLAKANDCNIISG